MGFTSEMIVLSLVSGVIIGVLYVIENAVVKLLKLNKVFAFIFDSLFMCLVAVICFLVSLAISAGFPRLLQYLFTAIAFACVLFIVPGFKSEE